MKRQVKIVGQTLESIYRLPYVILGLIIIKLYRKKMSILQPSPLEQQILSELNQYVTNNQISLQQFWKTERLCLTIPEFLTLLKQIHYQLPQIHLEQLQQHNIEFINLEVVMKGVEYWLLGEESVGKFIAKEKREVGDGVMEDQVQRGERSGMNFNRQDLKINRSNLTTEIKKIKPTLERQLKKQNKLNQTLLRAKNESDYELTIKIGQTNDICNKLKNEISYIIDSEDNTCQIIEIKAKVGERRVISRKQFEKKYEVLKASSFSLKKELYGNLEDDLKKTMVQVMYLSGQLQEQINLLLSKGINH